jgi:ribosomal protein L11 methyltransferase
MLELFPEGFEELGGEGGGLELAAYTNAAGEERIWQAFGGAASATDVEEDWQDRWRQFHKPVRVGSLWIGPPWETPDADAILVVIDPGRAFGTGGHPTTQLCLQLLEGEERASVLDVGCGSGVLSIAAAKLGFDPVTALDFDPQAVEATERNALDNGVVVDVSQADLREDSLPEAALALANIAAEAVVALGPRLRADRAITSGYLVSDEPELEGYRRDRRIQSGGWAADLHVRK